MKKTGSIGMILTMAFAAFAQMQIKNSDNATVVTVTQQGTVGVGNINPDATAKIDVAGKSKTQNFQMTGGTPSAGEVMSSDALGNATWRPPLQVYELISTVSNPYINYAPGLTQVSQNFTVPTTGYYLFLWSCELQSTGTANGGYVRLYKGDNTVSYSQLSVGTPNAGEMNDINSNGTSLIYFTSGTVLKVMALTYSTGHAFWHHCPPGAGYCIWGQLVLLFPM